METPIQSRELQCERILEQEDVSRFDHVDLAVEARVMTFLKGPVVSGKNQLLRLLSLKESPNAGGLWYRGTSTATRSEFERANLCNQRFRFAELFECSVLQLRATGVVTARRPLPTVLPDHEIEMAEGRAISDTLFVHDSGGDDS